MQRGIDYKGTYLYSETRRVLKKCVCIFGLFLTQFGTCDLANEEGLENIHGINQLGGYYDPHESEGTSQREQS